MPSEVPEFEGESEVLAVTSSLQLSVAVAAKDLTRGTHTTRAEREGWVGRERPDGSF